MTSLPLSSARSTRRFARGITLVELMVVLAMMTFVLAASGYAYHSMRAVQKDAVLLSRVNGDARVALDLIAQEIRQAGFIGCNSELARESAMRSTETTVQKVSGLVNDFSISAENVLRAFKASDAASWGGAGEKPANAIGGDSHVIEVRYAGLEGATRLNGGPDFDRKVIKTRSRFEPSWGDDQASVVANRMGLISDCHGTMLFGVDSRTVDEVQMSPLAAITASACGHSSRTEGDCMAWEVAAIYPIRVVQFYVANLGTVAAPDLYLVARKRIMSATDPSDGAQRWNAPQPVVAGVASLRVYGLGLDAAAPEELTYRVQRTRIETEAAPDVLTGMTAAEWARVSRIDVRLRMQPDNGRPSGGGTSVLRNFESSIAVRGRLAFDPR